MNGDADSVPVLLLGFNRPDKLRRVVEPLRLIKPKRVFVCIDGPRSDRPNERCQVQETRDVAELAVNWECELHTLFRPTNLGCRASVTGAISWAFEQVDELMILEDDCVIDPSFATLCRVLLDRHRADENIFNIGAVNFQQGHRRGDGDYFASKYPHCWGWATWKRAWQHYTDDLSQLSPCDSLHEERERDYWQLIYERCAKGRVDSWAYRWTFRCWQQGGLTLLPNANLVTNIGFDDEATHTNDEVGGPRTLQSLETFKPPPSLTADREADQFTFDQVFCPIGSEDDEKRKAFALKRAAKAKTQLKTPLKARWWRF